MVKSRGARKETLRLNFTKRVLEALPVPAERYTSYRDTDVKSLGFVVTAKDCRSFTWFRKVNGKAEYKVLGQFPAMAVDAARDAARKLDTERVDVKLNGGEMFTERRGSTLDSIFTAYMVYREKSYDGDQSRKAQRLKEDRDCYERYLKRLGSLRIGQIQKDQLKRIHRSVDGDRAANRVIQFLRSMINYAIKENLYTGANPTVGFQFNKEKSRERFLLPSELPRLLPHLSGDLRDLIFLNLQTGMRKGNLLAMRWSQIQLIDGEWLWMIPTTKNGEPHVVALLDSVVDCLNRRPGAHSMWRPGTKTPTYGGDWVFPSDSKTGHLGDFPKRAWKEARAKAGLKDLHVHDLRRTTGSWMAASGASLPLIGKALGHRSERSTKIYARLQLAPVRAQLKQAMGVFNG